jgi:glucose-1-phosphate cytidylyltransferase
MKVIILCGGIGTRLREETEFKPKPMVLVGGKPILWHIMKIYAHYGFNDFIIALGYKGDQIRQYFLDQKYYLNNFSISTKTGSTHIHKNRKDEDKRDDFKITFVDTGLETQPGERILRCKKYIPKEDKYFMVTYGDGVTDLNINDVLKFHKKQKTIGTITGVHPRSKFGLVKIDKNNLVKGFEEKPVLPDWVNGGYMVFDKRFFNYLEVGQTEHPALKKLAKENKLSIYKHDGFWYAVDTFKELDDLNKIWEENQLWKVWR